MSEQPTRVGPALSHQLDAPDEYVDPARYGLKPTRVEPGTVLDDLMGDLTAALTAEISSEPVVLEVLKRPGVSVRYRTDLNDDELSRFRKLAKGRTDDDFNVLRFCLLILADKSDGFFWQGTEVLDEAGQSLTFGHKRLRDLYGKERAADVARACIGNDQHVQIMANRIMDLSGFGDQAVEVDEGGPTPAS